jgi:hypothetical protein
MHSGSADWRAHVAESFVASLWWWGRTDRVSFLSRDVLGAQMASSTPGVLGCPRLELRIGDLCPSNRGNASNMELKDHWGQIKTAFESGVKSRPSLCDCNGRPGRVASRHAHRLHFSS